MNMREGLHQRALSLFIAVIMALSMFIGTGSMVNANTVEGEKTIIPSCINTENYCGTIIEDGTYKIKNVTNNNAPGEINIESGKKVTLVGDKNTLLKNLSINCGDNVDLTIKDVRISGRGAHFDQAYYDYQQDQLDFTWEIFKDDLDFAAYTKESFAIEFNMVPSGWKSDENCIINFSGMNNTLTLEGENLLENEKGAKHGLIHVGPNAGITIQGTGSLYFFKDGSSAAIGGSLQGSNNGEVNGKITINGGNLFGKSTTQGPAIGSTSNGTTGTPGDITINGGNIHLIVNSMSPGIGGGANFEGTPGKIIVNGGALSFNVDWGGPAFGWGKKAEPGTVIINGGSIRTFIDKNAADGIDYKGMNSFEWNGEQNVYGVCDVAISTDKKNANGKDVYLIAVDTSDISSDTYEVKVDGALHYKGGRHKWAYVNEDKVKGEDGWGEDTVSVTKENWKSLSDPYLYLYLTGENHTIDINGKKFTVTWKDPTELNSHFAGNNFTITPVQDSSGDSAGGTIGGGSIGGGSAVDTAELQKAADAVIVNIAAIGTVSLESKEAIQEARAAYDALKEEAKKLVTNLSLLEEAEQQLTDLEAAAKKAADAVDEKITAIGTISLESKEAIQEARAAYDALDAETKKLVTNLSLLEAAEQQLEKLEAELQKEADTVIAKIAAIGTVTLKSETAIKAARTAYVALQAEAKSLVSNLSLLEAAEQQLEKLKIAANTPAAVTGTKASSASATSIKLTWKKASKAKGYQVFRSTSKKGNYRCIKTTTSISYTDKKLKTGQTYYYKVRAYSSLEGKKLYGSYSGIVSVKPVPAAPTLKASAGKNSATCKWAKVAGAGKYQVYRSSKKSGSYKKIGETAKTSYKNTKLKKGTYYYKVRAYVKVSGKKVYSSYSKIVKVKVK